MTPCDQARECVSLALDGELVEVDRMRLDAHLASCAECRDFRADIHAVARELRSAEPDEPAYPFVLPRARRLSVRSIQVGAAAAAVVAIVAAGSVFQGLGLGRQAASSETIRLSQTALFSAGDDVAPNLHPTAQRPLKHRVAV